MQTATCKLLYIKWLALVRSSPADLVRVRREKLLVLGIAVMRHVAVAATERLYESGPDSGKQAAELKALVDFLGQEYVLPLRHMAGLTLTTIAMFFRLPDHAAFGALPRQCVVLSH